MKRTLESSANRIRDADRRAYIRRAMWPALEGRIRNATRKLRACTASDVLGGLSFSCTGTTDPGYATGQYSAYRSLNQAQVSVGSRSLYVFHTVCLEPLSRAELGFESGASIVFSQDVTGRVAVFLFPYKSKLAKVQEENILLHFGLEPNHLTDARVERCMKMFLRYAVASSASRSGSFRDYVFRSWLLYKDLRNKRTQQKTVIVFTERVLLVALAAFGILATLWTSNK